MDLFPIRYVCSASEPIPAMFYTLHWHCSSTAFHTIATLHQWRRFIKLLISYAARPVLHAIHKQCVGLLTLDTS